MKRFGVLLLAVLVIPRIAWPQIESGTAILVMWDKNEVTIGADSRATGTATGAHNDCYCKIATFGNKFFFTFSGITADDSHRWSANSVAFSAWQSERMKRHSSRALVHAVADRWNASIEKVYTDAELLRGHGTGEILGQPVFGAADDAGNIAVLSEDVVFDPDLFYSTGKISISISVHDMIEGESLLLGRTEIITEYAHATSDRARKDVAAFRPAIASLNPSDWRAAMVAHLITRAVELDPHRDELSLPVDIVQLKATVGLDVRREKPTCQKYDPKNENKPCRGKVQARKDSH